MKKFNMMDRFIKWLWRKRLKSNGYEVVKVKGWRTFLVDEKNGSRQTVTFLFK